MNKEIQRENTTFSIDPEVKMEFKVECAKNYVNMSIPIEEFMKNYVTASKSLRDEE